MSEAVMALPVGDEDSMDDALFGGDEWELFSAFSAGLQKAPTSAVLGEEPMDEGVASDFIDIEDFDGPDQFVFALLKQKIRNACNVNTAWTSRQKAADWIFMSRTPDQRGITFFEACRALGARRTVIQARVQYQLYRAGVPYQEPLNFLCDSLPEAMCGELLYQFNENAMNIAKLMWSWPGIRADRLVIEVANRIDLSSEKINELLRRMEQGGYVALKHGFWFFISRNPDTYPLMGRRRFQWSKAFVGGYD